MKIITPKNKLSKSSSSPMKSGTKTVAMAGPTSSNSANNSTIKRSVPQKAMSGKKGC